MKTQLVVNRQNEEIICLSFSNGKKHDFRLFKESGVHINSKTILQADTGYQGIAELHTNSVVPKKNQRIIN